MSKETAISNLEKYSQPIGNTIIDGNLELELSYRDKLCRPFALEALMQSTSLSVDIWDRCAQNQGSSENSLLKPLQEEKIINYHTTNLTLDSFEEIEPQIIEFLKKESTLGIIFVISGSSRDTRHVFSVRLPDWNQSGDIFEIFDIQLPQTSTTDVPFNIIGRVVIDEPEIPYHNAFLIEKGINYPLN